VGEREEGRAKRVEKELEGFKSWLGGVCRVKRVVKGC